jgi:hypothetical protein
MGVGTSTSKATNETIVETVTNTLNTNITNCSSDSIAKSTVNMSNITIENCAADFGTIEQVSIQSPSLTCVASAKTKNDIKNKLVADLSAKSSAETGLVIGAASSDSTSSNTVISDNTINTMIENKLNCIASSISDQTVNKTNLNIKCQPRCIEKEYADSAACKVNLGNVHQKIVSNAVTDCLSEFVAEQKAESSTDVKATSESSATTKVSFSFGMITMLVAIVIIFVLLGVAFKCRKNIMGLFRKDAVAEIKKLQHSLTTEQDVVVPAKL